VIKIPTNIEVCKLRGMLCPSSFRLWSFSPEINTVNDWMTGCPPSRLPRWQCRRHKRRGLDPRVRKIPWRRKWEPTPASLSGEPHGQRSLAGYGPWGCRGRHNLKGLQFSSVAQLCLTLCNPMDRSTPGLPVHH